PALPVGLRPWLRDASARRLPSAAAEGGRAVDARAAPAGLGAATGLISPRLVLAQPSGPHAPREWNSYAGGNPSHRQCSLAWVNSCRLSSIISWPQGIATTRSVLSRRRAVLSDCPQARRRQLCHSTSPKQRFRRAPPGEPSRPGGRPCPSLR